MCNLKPLTLYPATSILEFAKELPFYVQIQKYCFNPLISRCDQQLPVTSLLWFQYVILQIGYGNRQAYQLENDITMKYQTLPSNLQEIIERSERKIANWILGLRT